MMAHGACTGLGVPSAYRVVPGRPNQLKSLHRGCVPSPPITPTGALRRAPDGRSRRHGKPIQFSRVTECQQIIELEKRHDESTDK
jgi:hypothetical protein